MSHCKAGKKDCPKSACAGLGCIHNGNTFWVKGFTYCPVDNGNFGKKGKKIPIPPQGKRKKDGKRKSY